jgi:hypothetical protein
MNRPVYIWFRRIGRRNWFALPQRFDTKADALHALPQVVRELNLTGLVFAGTTRPEDGRETTGWRCVANGRILPFRGDPRDTACKRVAP